jgi:hypothetical protein
VAQRKITFLPDAPSGMITCALRPYEGLGNPPTIVKPSVKGFISLNHFKGLTLQPTLLSLSVRRCLQCHQHRLPRDFQSRSSDNHHPTTLPPGGILCMVLKTESLLMLVHAYGKSASAGREDLGTFSMLVEKRASLCGASNELQIQNAPKRTS